MNHLPQHQWLLRFGVCAAFLIATQFLFASRTNAEDIVTFDHTEFNFGQMRANNFASHTFWIHASGNDTIVIDTVIPGCGCTSIPLSENTLAPGDSVAFEILFDSKDLIGSVAKKPGFRLQGDSAVYNFKFYASILTKDVQFFPLAIRPSVMSLQEKPARSGAEFPFQIHNSSDEDVKIDIVDYPSEIFDFYLPDSIPAEGTIAGHFSLLPGYPEDENIYKSITFEVNHSELYRLTTPILMKSAKADANAPDSNSVLISDSLKQRK